MRVAAAALVPGVLMRMALMEPPKLEPKKMAASISRAGTVPIWKVKGSSTVMARLPFSPGIAPKMMPMNSPMLTKMKFSMVKRFPSAAMMVSPIT